MAMLTIAAEAAEENGINNRIECERNGINNKKTIFLIMIYNFIKILSRLVMIVIRVKWRIKSFCISITYDYIFLLYWPPTSKRAVVICPKEHVLVASIRILKIFLFFIAASCTFIIILGVWFLFPWWRFFNIVIWYSFS